MKDPWLGRLPPLAYAVTRLGATEPPFSGAYWDHHEPGRYRCACCRVVLFESASKFDSASGWPSFDAPAGPARVRFVRDLSRGLERVDVRCALCSAHLGHVFEDGPTATGERYCINSAALNFEAGSPDTSGVSSEQVDGVPGGSRPDPP